MWQSETLYYFNGCRRTSQTRWDNVRLFSTSRVVRQLHKHDGTKSDCLVVNQGMYDNFTSTKGQNETVWYLNGCQITSQTWWDKARLFSTSMVVRQLHKHDGTKWDCLVHQWLSDNFTNTMGQSETLVHQVFLDNFTNTMWQSETVEYFNGCPRTSQTRWGNVRLLSTSRVVRQLHKHDGTMWDCLVPQRLSDNFTNTMWQRETVWYLKCG